MAGIAACTFLSCCASVCDNDPKRARNKRRKQPKANGCRLVLRLGRIKEADCSRLSKRIIISDHTKTPTNFRDTRLHAILTGDYFCQPAQKDSEARRAFWLFVFVARVRKTSTITYHQHD